MNAPEKLAPALAAGLMPAGRFFIGAQAYQLIVATGDEGELIETPWSGKSKKVEGALSYCDGLANTRAMAAAGSELGKWALGLRIGGFDDWHIPSRLEALIAFGELGDKDIFAPDWYWTSTQYARAAGDAWCQYFGDGHQDSTGKGLKLRARAVRRLPI